MIDPIKIDGLREFQKGLKDMDGETQKKLKVVLDDAAGVVVRGASSRVPARTGRARASVRARSSQREAKVLGGSAKVPYYGFLDFGGSVGRKKATRRPFVSEGRYLYPAFHANRDGIYKALQQSLVKLAEQAGLEVDSGG